MTDKVFRWITALLWLAAGAVGLASGIDKGSSLLIGVGVFDLGVAFLLNPGRAA